MDKNQTKINRLSSSLQELCSGYKKIQLLLNDQMQAVIRNDIDLLNSLIDQQTEKYDGLQQTEEVFKERLVDVFNDYHPDTEQPSLTRLMDVFEGPTRELEQLRKNFVEQIENTEQVRRQLVDLLTFAAEQNSRSITILSQLRNPSSENYSSSGEIAAGETQSLGLNQKV
ncbi:MAG: flagellar export chaperone FlgN [Balneolaceae bacterium]